MAECGENVGKGMISYPCTLTSAHEGPHKANENDASVRERKLWETDLPAWEAQQEAKRVRALPPEQRHAESGLGQFQGRAETTAERYTENPTSHPGVLADDPGPALPEVPVSYVERGDGTAEFTTSQVPTRSIPRQGEQGLPTINDRPNAQDALIKAIEERKAIGLERYGTLLQPFNGRNSFKDILDEFVDGAVYGMALEMERAEMVEEVELAHGFLNSIFGPEHEVVKRIKRVMDWLAG